MAENPVDQAIDAIYVAGVDPAAWPDALRRMRDCLHGAAACIFVMDNETLRVPHWAGLNLEAGSKDYREHYVTIDPRARYAAENPHTRIHYDRMLIDERGMDRSEFYDWQSKSADGLRYFVGCRFPVPDGQTGFAAMHWHRRHGHAQQAQVRLFTRLGAHVERAVQLNARLGTTGLQIVANQVALDDMDRALILLDRDRRIMSLNRAAEQMLVAGDGLTVRNRRLAALRADEDRMLQSHIGTAAAGLPPPPHDLCVTRRGVRYPYLVHVFPVPGDGAAFASNGPTVAVVVVDPARRPVVPAETLMHVFGLTRTEASIAVRIATGTTIKQTAGEFGIAVSTARLHLQRIMQKTGTHRQSALIQLLTATARPPR